MGQSKEAQEYFKESDKAILRSRFMVGTCSQCGSEYANKTAYKSTFRGLAEGCGLLGPGHESGFCESCSKPI